MHSEYVLEDWRIPEHEGVRGIKTGEYQSIRALVESGIQRVSYSNYHVLLGYLETLYNTT